MATRTARGGRTIEELLTAAGTAAGAVAGLAGFVYLVGGLVMWLRFRTADLPADQGVALMSREQLFVVGLRLMIIPLLVTGFLAALLAYRATNERAWRPLRTVTILAAAILAALLVVWAFAVARWPTGLALLLETVVLTGAACVLVSMRGHARGLRLWPALAAAAAAALVLVLCLAVPALRVSDNAAIRLAVAAVALLAMFAPALVSLAPRAPRLGRHRRWVLPVVAVLAVGLIVPWSFASATWPIGLGLLLGIWLWRRRRLQAATDAQAPHERRRLAQYMAAAAVVAAAVVSIGRQLDEPVQLLHATVVLKETGAANVEGAYVNASGDNVYVGDLARRTIIAIPRAEVRQVALGPPDQRAPSASLLSRIIPGDERFSVRPLEVWCDGHRYGWTEAGKLCRTQPKLLWKTRLHHRDFDRLGAPVRVSCPPDARDVCRGWVLLRSRSNYLHGPVGVPRPVVPKPVPFAVGAGKPTEVCLGLTTGQFQLLRRSNGEKPVAFDAVIANDRAGETVYDRGYYGLLVGPTRVESRPLGASDCEPRLTLSVVAKGDAVGAKVTARPRARGITPWRVEGAIRLSATDADGSVRELGEKRLKGGQARFAITLRPGTWVIDARYTSVARVPYADVLAEATITVARQ